VVARDVLDERRLVQALRGNRVAEQRGRLQVAFADRHEPQARHVRQPPAAADDEHLAVVRPADVREPAGAEPRPFPQVVDRAEADERAGAAELALAVERGPGRMPRQRATQLAANVPVERRVRRHLAADAEPVHADRAHLGRDLRDLARDLTVLGGPRPRQHGGEHRRRRRQPEHDEEQRSAPPAQARARQPEGERDPAQSPHRHTVPVRSAAAPVRLRWRIVKQN
jgi:hypothetical protein